MRSRTLQQEGAFKGDVVNSVQSSASGKKGGERSHSYSESRSLDALLGSENSTVHELPGAPPAARLGSY